MSIVIGGLGFLVAILTAAWLFGRPDDSRPRCGRCRADVRKFAWDDPLRCTCGADLGRPGAVRSSGRLRRPRFGWVAALVALTAIGVVAASYILERRGLAWSDVLPRQIVEVSARNGEAWARESLRRRIGAGSLSRESVQRLVLAGVFGEHLPKLAGGLIAIGPGVRHAVGAEVELLRGLLRVSPQATRKTPSEAEPPRDEALVVLVELGRVSWLDHRSIALLRVDRVLLDGVPATWSLRVQPLPSMVGERVVLHGAELLVRDPSGGERLNRVVTIDGVLAISAAGLGAVGDPLIDSPLPPQAWRVDTVWMPVSVTVPFAAPSVAERSP